MSYGTKFSVLDRAAKYLAKMPGGVQGSNGSESCFNAAMVLVKGFSLTDSDAMDLLLRDYNPKCNPEWSRSELQHKIDDAKSSTKPDGYLLQSKCSEQANDVASGLNLTNFVEVHSLAFVKAKHGITYAGLARMAVRSGVKMGSNAICFPVYNSIGGTSKSPVNYISVSRDGTVFKWKDKEGNLREEKVLTQYKGKNGIVGSVDHVDRLVRGNLTGYRVLITAGPTDLAALHSSGLPENVIAITQAFGEGGMPSRKNNGTEHILDLLATSGCEILIAYDTDETGVTSAAKLATHLASRGCHVKVLDLRKLELPGKDIRDFIASGATTNQIIEIADFAERVIKTPEMIAEGSQNGSALPEALLPGGEITISSFASHMGGLMAQSNNYFSRGGVPMRGVVDDAGLRLEPLRPANAMTEFESVARLAKLKVDKEGIAHITPAICTEAIARAVVFSQAFQKQLPDIKVVSRCPVLIERDDKLIVISGFDQEAATYAQGDVPPDMPLDEAKRLIQELITDFKFATEGDKSRAVAAFIAPALVLGGLLGGRAPVDVGEADNSQSGKGYRSKLVTSIYCQDSRTITQRERGVGSMQESFDASLVSGSSFICFDNLRGTLDCPWLESFLTESTYSARVPYAVPVAIDTRYTIVSLTTNKAELTTDFANRCSVVRIRHRGDGYRFMRFQEGDLLAHVQANQPRYLGAVFAIIRHWHESGKPTLSETQHDFRRWNQVLGYIVEKILGFAPLLDGHRDVQQRMTDTNLTWLRSVAQAAKEAGLLESYLRPHQVLNIVLDRGIDTPGVDPHLDIDDATEFAKATRNIGRKLSASMKGEDVRHVDDFTVKKQFGRDENGRERTEYSFSRISPNAPSSPECSPNENPVSPNPLIGLNTFKNFDSSASSRAGDDSYKSFQTYSGIRETNESGEIALGGSSALGEKIATSCTAETSAKTPTCDHAQPCALAVSESENPTPRYRSEVEL